MKRKGMGWNHMERYDMECKVKVIKVKECQGNSRKYKA
jgi:hypothetical protein